MFGVKFLKSIAKLLAKIFKMILVKSHIIKDKANFVKVVRYQAHYQTVWQKLPE